jgi:hypothetical protein
VVVEGPIPDESGIVTWNVRFADHTMRWGTLDQFLIEEPVAESEAA